MHLEEKEEARESSGERESCVREEARVVRKRKTLPPPPELEEWEKRLKRDEA